MKRIHSIDIIRGLVMIIMALDHTRDLFHDNYLAIDPVDLTKTTPVFFFTRWITHLCAPTFVFLSGVSAYLSMSGKNDIPGSRRFLIKRGLWLILLELTVINFGIWMDVKFGMFMFQVIGAIGFSFVILGLLLPLKSRVIGFIGLAIILLHNLLVLLPPSPVTSALAPLFSPAFYQLGFTNFLLNYPPIPWLGLMLAGFGFAKNFQLPDQQRRRTLLITGVIALAVFVVLRFTGVYGDPSKFAVQKNGLFTLLSFINVTKYPPSLQYDLLMLGIMFFLLLLTDTAGTSRVARFIEIYGKVPLFYYLIHWYVLHTLMFIMLGLQGFGPKDFVFGFNLGRPNTGSGLPLWGVYIVWICVVLALYPLCKWYSKYKAAHKDNHLLRYL